MSLYDERIKDLAARAARFPRPQGTCVSRTLDNYLCGDRVTLAVEGDGGRVGSIGTETRGCLLTLAAAALICERGPDSTTDALRRAIADARALVGVGRAPPAAAWRDLEVFSPVHGHKHRHDCVLLPFEALEACLDGLAGDRPAVNGRPQTDRHGRTSAEAPAVSAVLLCAGASRRMGAVNKLLVPIEGAPMVRHAAAAILGSGVAELVAVLGHDRTAVAAALDGLPLKTIHNADHGDGQVTSVRAGLTAVSPASGAVMMCLADQPLLGAEDYRRLIAAFATLPPGMIAIPTHNGKRGNPVVLPAALKDEVLARGATFGCRDLIRENPGLVTPVEMENPGFLIDIDTLEALEAHVAPAKEG